MADNLAKKKTCESANTLRTRMTPSISKLAVTAPGKARGFVRDHLPDTHAYFEAQGLILKGNSNSVWKTTQCRFHGGSDSLRIAVATGAFVCMACGAKGGDVLAYEMATYGIGFVDAAKRLRAWAGGDAPNRHIRPTALTARDALSVLADEANLIAIESGRMAEGIKPSPEDRARFLVAVGRFNHVWGMFA